MADKSLLDYVNSGEFPNIKPRRMAVEIGKEIYKGGKLYMIAYPTNTGLRVEDDRVIQSNNKHKQFHDYGIISSRESEFKAWAQELNDSIGGTIARKSSESVLELMHSNPDEYDKYLESLRTVSNKANKTKSGNRMDWKDAHIEFSKLKTSDNAGDIETAIDTIKSHIGKYWRRDNKIAAEALLDNLQDRLRELE
ncbi:hypothetical protein [Deinococcus sp. RIT780]|uniref:hypothetical protein n=1 Tax=Deinococcus sp. RIT780 TaxID=2870472 RepID=UPI001C8AE142|nr:hypothetical protein [Deinococcus sp. RIT780]MBX8465282.1 hypothetical protein [Deinococcus sp. RIT780]